ncbi:MAG TPA: redox-regulated ATPase YchF, partial [Afifellaceae bacterium]|nr:redox-regulated ATPase YchF [Afifellaceae bacterium]
MGFKCGIVGLPNVGKSTLFNALTRTAAAQAENYPFCTIEPNTGDVAVPDPRLFRIAELAKSKNVVPTRLTFVDIAGLVRGASRGEGLGNQFLANIREVDAIAHVLRCFEDSDVTHVEGRIDPLTDAETVETELMLADLESLERRIEPLRKRATARDKEALAVLPLMERALAALNDGRMVRTIRAELSEDERRVLRGLNLLTAKPVLYVCNVAEADAASGNADTARIAEKAAAEGAGMVV